MTAKTEQWKGFRRKIQNEYERSKELMTERVFCLWLAACFCWPASLKTLLQKFVPS